MSNRIEEVKTVSTRVPASRGARQRTPSVHVLDAAALLPWSPPVVIRVLGASRWHDGS